MGASQSLPSSPENAGISESDSASAIVPVTFSWSGRHAHSVYVTGSWDGWTHRVALSRRPGTDFNATLPLPVGYYQFKYIVDGNWQHSPILPTTTDAHGNLNNVADVKPQKLEFDVDPEDDKAPPSPRASYNRSAMPFEEMRCDPPELPFNLGPVSAVSRAINFTRHDHLFLDNADENIMSETRTLSVMERYNDKIIRTTHIYPRHPPKLSMANAELTMTHNAFGSLPTHVFR